jgi:hypothetical protein
MQLNLRRICARRLLASGLCGGEKLSLYSNFFLGGESPGVGRLGGRAMIVEKAGLAKRSLAGTAVLPAWASREVFKGRDAADGQSYWVAVDFSLRALCIHVSRNADNAVSCRTGKVVGCRTDIVLL